MNQFQAISSKHHKDPSRLLDIGRDIRKVSGHAPRDDVGCMLLEIALFDGKGKILDRKSR